MTNLSAQVICTVALFAPILGISLATNNVGVVLSFKGSCLSSLVVYIIPGLACVPLPLKNTTLIGIHFDADNRYIRLMQPSGLKESFGPWLLVVYGIGAVPACSHFLAAAKCDFYFVDFVTPIRSLMQFMVSWEPTSLLTTSPKDNSTTKAFVPTAPCPQRHIRVTVFEHVLPAIYPCLCICFDGTQASCVPFCVFCVADMSTNFSQVAAGHAK